MSQFNAADAIADLVAKADIRQAVTNLQRGLDRRDAGLLGSTFHADAQVEYGFFNGSAAEFCALMTGDAQPPAHQVTMHRPSNLWIRVDGDQAISESYVFAYSPSGEGDGAMQALIGGRYLDRHEHRAGEWRLVHRAYVLDWSINQPASGSALPGFSDASVRGGWGADDAGARWLSAWASNVLKHQQQGQQGGKVEISQTLAAKAEMAFAKGEIHDLIVAMSRAVDRSDEAALRALWHPGAAVDMGDHVLSADDFCDLMLETVRDATHMYHSLANQWIRVDGDNALSETYVIAFYSKDRQDALIGGRYLDRFQQIDGVWRFSFRTFVHDWQIDQPSTDQRDGPNGMYAALGTRGALHPDDPVYAFWR